MKSEFELWLDAPCEFEERCRREHCVSCLDKQGFLPAYCFHRLAPNVMREGGWEFRGARTQQWQSQILAKLLPFSHCAIGPGGASEDGMPRWFKSPVSGITVDDYFNAVRVIAGQSLGTMAVGDLSELKVAERQARQMTVDELLGCIAFGALVEIKPGRG